MKISTLLLATFIWVSTAASARAPLLGRNLEETVENNYIVVLKQGISTDKAKGYYRSLRTSPRKFGNSKRGIVREFGNIAGMQAIHVECDEAMLESIRQSPQVDYVAKDERIKAHDTIVSKVFEKRATAAPGLPWGLGRISHRAPGILAYANTRPPPTRLYVLDTGIRLSHEQFSGRAIWGANFVDGAPNTDDNGHGTHTAATAAGNTMGVDNSTIPIAVKCLDGSSQGTWSGVMAAIDWVCGNATALGAIHRSVINMSIGGPEYQPLDDMVQKAHEQGMVMVVAAGNYYADACGYSPARAPNGTTVAAIDKFDSRPDWSNWGSCVDIFAPGDGILSAWGESDTSYATLSGTSMASPHVAGLATFLMAREGLTSRGAVHARLVELATPDMVKGANGSPNRIAFNGVGLAVA